MIFPRATRLVAILSVVLAFGILVCGSPVLTEKRFASTAVDQAYDTLRLLKSGLSEQYSKIDAHRANGTDATEDVEKIVQLFDSATARMKELPKDSNCPLNDKCPKIFILWIQILIDLVKWAKLQKLETRAISIEEALMNISSSLGTSISALGSFLSGISNRVAGLTGGLGNLLDSIRPNMEQLREQLIGHGLNGDIFEIIRGLMNALTGGSG